MLDKTFKETDLIKQQFLTVTTSAAPSPRSSKNRQRIKANKEMATDRGLYSTIS